MTPDQKKAVCEQMKREIDIARSSLKQCEDQLNRTMTQLETGRQARDEQQRYCAALEAGLAAIENTPTIAPQRIIRG